MDASTLLEQVQMKSLFAHRYIDECMVSIIKTNGGIEEPTTGYQICDTNHIFI